MAKMCLVPNGLSQRTTPSVDIFNLWGASLLNGSAFNQSTFTKGSTLGNLYLGAHLV